MRYDSRVMTLSKDLPSAPDELPTRETQPPGIDRVSLPSPWRLGVGTAWMLAKREWVRFFRQPFRVIAALGQPILFWLLFGTGLHGAFRGPDGGGDFMTYFLPGTAALILLFTAIFATISIIEDRREGFLQGVLVAPPGRWSIVIGKALGGSAIAWAQAMVFLGLAAAVGTLPLGWHWVPMMAFLFLSAFGITSLGVLVAWPMDSTQGYHAVMNLVLLPMWLLSGAFFPIPSLTDSQPMGQLLLNGVMRLNPMTYIVAGIRDLLNHSVGGTEQAAGAFWVPSLVSCWWITLIFTGLMIVLAIAMVRKRQRGEWI